MTNTPLIGALQNTSLHALLMIVSKGLARAGFGDVSIQDRRQPRQKSRHGGHEIQCLTSVGSLPSKVVVKVIRDSVRVRMLDELAGTVLRTGADLGLIISPFQLTRKAKAHLSSYGVARISALDGGALSDLLVRTGIGVRGSGSVDYEFFGGIEEVAEKLEAFLSSKPL